MKRFIINVFVFLGLVYFLDICVGIGGDYLQSRAKSGITKRINDIAIDKEYDVMIMGSSRAHHHYDAPYLTDTLGVRVYNAGYDGNGVILAIGLLELLTERYHPKLLIYDVEPAFDINVYVPDNNNTRYIGRLKPFWRHKAVGDIIRYVSNEEWYKVHFGMLRYNSEAICLLVDNLRTREDRLMGFDPLYGIYTEDPVVEHREKEQDPVKLYYMERFVRRAKELTIPLIVVASPKLGTQDSDVLNPVKDICRRYDVPFWDFYSTERYQKKVFFKEPTHLNKEGARLYSSEIAEMLRILIYKNNDIINKRN